MVGLNANMEQWLSNLSPIETYLIAVPAVMLGSVLLVGGIVLLFEPRTMSDAEKLEAIRKLLQRVDEPDKHTHRDTPNSPLP